MTFLLKTFESSGEVIVNGASNSLSKLTLTGFLLKLFGVLSSQVYIFNVLTASIIPSFELV